MQNLFKRFLENVIQVQVTKTPRYGADKMQVDLLCPETYEPNHELFSTARSFAYIES